MIRALDSIAVSFGRSTRESVEWIGSLGGFLFRILKTIPFLVKKNHLMAEQMMVLGVTSIPIVILTAVFTGAVSAWQVQYLFADAVPLTYLGAAVGKAVFTELGPVLTALVVTGRVGAKLAAELGTMKVTEQVDAMVCLSLEPYSYLLAPRFLAATIMVPVLTVFSAFFAIVSAQLLAEYALGLSFSDFYKGVRLLFTVQDIVVCMVKAFVFGAVIALCGCYYGFTTKGGAVGVGASTRKAVVAAMVLILISNLIVVSLLL